jgi:hypothetical protein
MMFYRSPVEMSSVVYADGMAYIYWIYFTFGFDYTPTAQQHSLLDKQTPDDDYLVTMGKQNVTERS